MGFKLKKLVKQLTRSQDKVFGSDAAGLAGLGDAGAKFRLDEEQKKQAQNAAKAQEQAQAALANQQADNLRRNLATDLTTDNVANVEAGGTAYALDDMSGKRKQRGGVKSLSSSLGIRV